MRAEKTNVTAKPRSVKTGPVNITKAPKPNAPDVPVTPLQAPTKGSRMSSQRSVPRHIPVVRKNSRVYVPKLKEMMGALHRMSLHYASDVVDLRMRDLFEVATLADRDPSSSSSSIAVNNMIEAQKRFYAEMIGIFDERNMSTFVSEFVIPRLKQVNAPPHYPSFRYPTAKELDALVKAQNPVQGNQP